MKGLTYRRIFLLAAAVALVISVGSMAFGVFESEDVHDSQITVSTELKNISQAEIDEVKKQVLAALNSISPILGIEYSWSTEIIIVDTGICSADRGIISLSIEHIRDRSAPIIHEVTHILANHKHNSFFSEGLAVYFQERYGRTSGFPNFSVPLDDLVRYHRDQFFPITQLHENNWIFEQVGTELRRIAYLEAGSFFNFLVEKYGEQKLRDLHNSSILDYEAIYGKRISELEAEWQRYIFEDSSVIKSKS